MNSKCIQTISNVPLYYVHCSSWIPGGPHFTKRVPDALISEIEYLEGLFSDTTQLPETEVYTVFRRQDLKRLTCGEYFPNRFRIYY